MKRKYSLFSRTAATVATGLIIFQLISILAIAMNIVFPLAQRSADDLAALLILSSQTWQASSEQNQQEFALHLLNKHGLKISSTTHPLQENQSNYPYLYFLRTALNSYLPESKHLQLTGNANNNFQVEFLHRGKIIHFDFHKSILGPKPVTALAWTLFAGFLATLIIAGLLARRITAPISRLVKAVRRIGQGEQAAELPETGGSELTELAQAFNQTSQQLHARRENQTVLLAGISHDLRSPLARMKMALGILAEQQSSPMIHKMERDIAEMDALIGSQLELAKAQEQELTKATHINPLLNDLIDGAEAREPGRLTLRTGSQCTINIAQVSLRRCLDNLINNALRYSGQSLVEVTCKQYHSTTYLNVRDRGPGIPEQLIDNIFRPFYRIESSRNRSTGGSGLGLAITRQLAETHGWQVAIKPRRGGGVSAWIIIKN